MITSDLKAQLMSKQTVIGSFALTSLVIASYVCASPVSPIDEMLEAVKARNEKSFLQTKSVIEKAEKPVGGEAEKAKSLYEQAMAAYKNQDFATAIDLFTKASASDPAHSRAATYLGMAQLKANNAVAAELALRRALVLEPNNSQAWMYLGDALAIQTKTDHAASSYYLAWYFGQNQ
ncbi:tetratricopeptide repeat protein [Noviherbaspirillum sp.]|uniref:tetratricopeptide repeat protein n=1 Tax=Noviherbaspirillum sp. TaxID=1926288 RepID=UPI002FE3ECD1